MSHWSQHRSATAEEMLDYLRTHVRRTEDGCLLWGGPMNGPRPYIKWHGKAHDARRLLLKLSGRKIDDKVQWTTCDEPSCMREEHIRIGTRAEMCQAKRSRFQTGALRSMSVALGWSHRARLPIQERSNVHRMLASGATQRQVAEAYGVSHGRVSQALRSWARATGNPLPPGRRKEAA